MLMWVIFSIKRLIGCNKEGAELGKEQAEEDKTVSPGGTVAVGKKRWSTKKRIGWQARSVTALHGIRSLTDLCDAKAQ